MLGELQELPLCRINSKPNLAHLYTNHNSSMITAQVKKNKYISRHFACSDLHLVLMVVYKSLEIDVNTKKKSHSREIIHIAIIMVIKEVLSFIWLVNCPTRQMVLVLFACVGNQDCDTRLAAIVGIVCENLFCEFVHLCRSCLVWPDSEHVSWWWRPLMTGLGKVNPR